MFSFYSLHFLSVFGWLKSKCVSEDSGPNTTENPNLRHLMYGKTKKTDISNSVT